MANILDLIADRKSRTVYSAVRETARDQFVSQKSAVEAISWTSWFKAIRDYRVSELLAGQERLRTMQSTDISEVQARCNVAMRFLDFLDSMQAETPEL